MIGKLLTGIAVLMAIAPHTVHAQQDAAALRRPSVTWLGILDMGGATVSADSAETKLVELPKGSRILVRPGSTVRHSTLPGGTRAGLLEVKGEVAVEVTEEQLTLEVVTRAGSARLLPGSYAMRCAGACAALEVTVARGFATIRPDRLGAASIALQSGQWGRAFRDSSAALVDAAAAMNFPLPDGSLRKAP